jgi:hypothetical protein
MDDPAIVDLIADHNELAPFTYSAEEVDRIMHFLDALTDADTLICEVTRMSSTVSRADFLLLIGIG